MKWAIPQLRKLKKPYNFEYDFDLLDHLPNPGDILDCKNCHVKGVMHEYLEDEYEFALSINVDLVMQCAVSLEPVPYNLNFDTEVRFTYSDDNGDFDYLIEKETIDLDEAVLSEIVLNLPYRVVKEGYEDRYSDTEPEEEKINPSFQALKDLYGGEDK